jgi:hypothetical protein
MNTNAAEKLLEVTVRLNKVRVELMDLGRVLRAWHLSQHSTHTAVVTVDSILENMYTELGRSQAVRAHQGGTFVEIPFDKQ